jgi:hypothetical protein
MRVEKTGDDGASAKVDRLGARSERQRLTHIDDASVFYSQGRSNHTATIDKLSVGKDVVARGYALRRTRRRSLWCADDYSSTGDHRGSAQRRLE